jgi:hypothetical protein
MSYRRRVHTKAPNKGAELIRGRPRIGVYEDQEPRSGASGPPVGSPRVTLTAAINVPNGLPGGREFANTITVVRVIHDCDGEAFGPRSQQFGDMTTAAVVDEDDLNVI